jgi:hypothetical protein
VLVAAAALALLAGCGGERSSYTKGDVQKAFAGQGFELGTPEAFNKVTPSSGTLLIPRSGEQFMVTVGPNSEADAGWADYERLGAVADSFDARRVNVVVISDGGMTAKQIERVLAALAALPDRGKIDVVSKRTDFERP